MHALYSASANCLHPKEKADTERQLKMNSTGSAVVLKASDSSQIFRDYRDAAVGGEAC